MNEINKHVNYHVMASNARLVILAESDHNPLSYKYEAIKALKQLKAAGYTHFAMEMLPLHMKETIAHYQKTGLGFDKIKKFIDKSWTRNKASGHGYIELIKAAHDLGFEIVPLDLSVEMMDIIDESCDFQKRFDMRGKCNDSHTLRNEIWAGVIARHLEESSNTKIVAFMHRYHAFKATDFHEGIASLMKAYGVLNIRIIDYVGGISCRASGCEGESSEQADLKNQYFYRKGSFMKAPVPSFTVHLPEKSLR